MVLLLVLAVSSSAAPPSVQREASVQAVSMGVSGAAVTSVTARIASNRAGVPSVGIVEELPSGSSEQWLLTLWQSALVATQATGASLLSFEFSLRVGGAIDRTSAGLLTASTLAALIKNKKIIPNTTIIGSINPDGSAGPVTSLLPRLRAAAAAGIKRFGLPLGGRHQTESGEVTDLVAEGKKLGVEVKELGNFDEAYSFLTGETLTRPAPVSESEMELWPAEVTALSRLTSEVRGELDVERKQVEKEPKFLERSMQTASDFEKSGDLVRAMVVWSATLTALRVEVQDARLLRLLAEKNFGAVLAMLEAQEKPLPAERSALRDLINKEFPNTSRANDVYAMDILESVVTQGVALEAEGTAKVIRALSSAGTVTDENQPRFQELARKYAADLLRAREELKNGERFLSLYASLPPLKKSLKPVDAAKLAPWYAAAGAASRASFKSREELFEKDSTYLDLLGYGSLLGTETDARARLVLAARQTIYAGYLVNTYDALGAQLDAKGAFSIRNSRALTAQLELAKAHVLQSCGQARRNTGSVPFPARMRFLNARAAREGSDRQKADALADLWISSWWCEFVARDQN